MKVREGADRDLADEAWSAEVGRPRDVAVACDDRLWNEPRRVDPRRTRRRELGRQREGPVERSRIGVDKEFSRVEPVAMRRIVGTVGTEAVASPGPEAGDEAAENVALLARQLEAGS